MGGNSKGEVCIKDDARTEWWTVRDTARYLGMSESFIRKAVKLRLIPFRKIGPKSIRFSKSALKNWLD